ncbi:hypothetical protein AOQ84DRAFT_357524 [Glonium stellatum]|uniref:Uncharacterized protein n=1 Tax=Glonium stellatum TaxID=574774 RepID=A0A8E2EPB3_9PEZI|nr:hypothetical protein AOQ84DRAFT_357524 [Glonium stellatum]
MTLDGQPLVGDACWPLAGEGIWKPALQTVRCARAALCISRGTLLHRQPHSR